MGRGEASIFDKKLENELILKEIGHFEGRVGKGNNGWEIEYLELERWEIRYFGSLKIEMLGDWMFLLPSSSLTDEYFHQLANQKATLNGGLQPAHSTSKLLWAAGLDGQRWAALPKAKQQPTGPAQLRSELQITNIIVLQACRRHKILQIKKIMMKGSKNISLFVSFFQKEIIFWRFIDKN